MRQPEPRQGAVSGKQNIFRAAHLTHAMTRDGGAWECVCVCERASLACTEMPHHVGWCDALMSCSLICPLMYAGPVVFVSTSSFSAFAFYLRLSHQLIRWPFPSFHLPACHSQPSPVGLPLPPPRLLPLFHLSVLHSSACNALAAVRSSAPIQERVPAALRLLLTLFSISRTRPFASMCKPVQLASTPLWPGSRRSIAW